MQSSKPYTKAVIFDFDHTLSETHGAAEMDKRIDEARQWSRDDWMKLTTFQKHKKVLGFRDFLEKHFRSGAEPTAKEGTIELLQELKDRGITVFVKSGGNPDRLKEQVKRIFGDLIPEDHVYAGRDGAPAKPESEAYTYILNKHGIAYDDPEQVVMIGDIVQFDLMPAVDHGMTALWLNEDGKPQPESEQLKGEGKIHEFQSMHQIHDFITNREAERASPATDQVTSEDMQRIEEMMDARRQQRTQQGFVASQIQR
jgi:FMN phosphatase YigB (HAD superfamily)